MSFPSSSRPSTRALAPSRGPLEELGDLCLAWQARIRGSRARAAAAAGIVLLFGAFLVARRGTGSYRALAVAALAGPVAAAAWAWLHERAVYRDPARVIQRLAGGSTRTARAAPSARSA